MSDSNRKNISQQLKEKVTPDSEKTTFEKVKEHVSDGFDRVKAVITPESHKSTTQHISDKVRGNMITLNFNT